ncbi:MAG: type II secretion system protein M [Acinetobacter sp.]|nr:MAG: type II secretion system protein M [Acinetobacter sp.]
MANFIHVLNRRFEQTHLRVQNYLDQLQQRERVALVVLAIFLLITILGCLLWFPHQVALKQQQRLTELKDTIHWMQTNAVQLSTESSEAMSMTEKVQHIAQQQGLTVQSQDNQGQMKLTTSHQNYAVLANFLTQLAQQGGSIVSMDMQKQPDGVIRLTATVQ